MTMLQEQAINIIKKLPDDKIYHVINILEGIERLFPMKDESELEKSQKAYKELQRYKADLEKSFFGILPAGITLEEAKEERLNKI